MDTNIIVLSDRRSRRVLFAGASSGWVVLTAIVGLSLAGCGTAAEPSPSARGTQASPQDIGNVAQSLGEACDGIVPCGVCEVCDGSVDGGADGGAGFCVADVGASCGDATVTDCNGANTCNSAGICLDNFVAVTTACGDTTNTTCDSADTCDGAGACLDNFAAALAACGDSTATDCDNADSCSGTGVCEDNFAAAATACGDSTVAVCNGADTCNSTGICLENLCVVEAGADAGDAAAGDAAAGNAGDGSVVDLDATAPASDAAAGGTGAGASGNAGTSGTAGSNGGNSGSNGGNSGSGGSSSSDMDAGLSAGGEAEDSGGCGCTVPGQTPTKGTTLLAFALLGLSMLWRRKAA